MAEQCKYCGSYNPFEMRFVHPGDSCFISYYTCIVMTLRAVYHLFIVDVDYSVVNFMYFLFIHKPVTKERIKIIL